MIGAVPRLTFIRPLSLSAAVRPPKGDDWLHEPKWDGFRFQMIKDGSGVRLYSKSGAAYSDRLPGMVEAFATLPARAAITRRRAMSDRARRQRTLLSAHAPDAHALAR